MKVLRICFTCKDVIGCYIGMDAKHCFDYNDKCFPDIHHSLIANGLCEKCLSDKLKEFELRRGKNA